MKRKIIRQGHNTLTITIPTNWATKYNVKPGQEVDLLEKENGLLITTEKTNEKRRVEFNLDSMDIPLIWKYFMAIYRSGYDEVMVKFQPDLQFENPYKYFSHHKLDKRYDRDKEKKNPIEFIHDVVNRFVGFEIVEHGKDFVIIKEIGETTPKEFDSTLRRIFLLIEQMAEETCEALKTKNSKILAHIHDVDINLDKFQDYCIRILNKGANKDSRKTALLFSSLAFLELIGDEYKTISHHIIYDFKDMDLKNIIPIAESIREQLKLVYETFYKYDLDKIKLISDIDSGRYQNVSKVSGKIKTDDEKEIFHHLRIIARYINALTEIRIEMEY